MVTYTPKSSIAGETRGSPEAWIEYVRARGGKRMDEVARFVHEVYRLAPSLGIAAHLTIAQAIHETGMFTSRWWTERLNPGGLDIVGDRANDEQSRYYPNGTISARAMLVHVSLYVFGRLSGEIAQYRHEDPRADRIPATALGKRTTLGSFGNSDWRRVVTWAADDNYGSAWSERINAAVAAGVLEATHTPPGDGTGGPQNGGDMALTFGRVPHPGYVDLQHTTADKPAGRGWDNLGKRNPKFIALHRMWGTLRGTDAHFGNPNVASLTDYGIGTGNIDGAALDGVIHKYNNPVGYRSGWASGRVSAPYGDGKCIIDKYGVNAVNRDGVSIETSGYENDPFTDFAWSELVKLCAYWIDQMEIPYTSLPLNPHTGCNAIIWHEEFTFGTGKRCPFTWMKNNTPRLYKDIQAYLKAFQEGSAGHPEPEPEEPEPQVSQYATPLPIEALAELADGDSDSLAAISTRESDEFIFVGDRVEATQDTPRLQYADMKAPHVGPVIKKGEQFDVVWTVRAADGNWYYISPWWTRIRVDHTKRISDRMASQETPDMQGVVDTITRIVDDNTDQ